MCVCVLRLESIVCARVLRESIYAKHAVQNDSRFEWVGVAYVWRAVYITPGITLVICVIVCLFVCVLCHSVYITYSYTSCVPMGPTDTTARDTETQRQSDSRRELD